MRSPTSGDRCTYVRFGHCFGQTLARFMLEPRKQSKNNEQKTTAAAQLDEKNPNASNTSISA